MWNILSISNGFDLRERSLVSVLFCAGTLSFVSPLVVIIVNDCNKVFGFEGFGLFDDNYQK